MIINEIFYACQGEGPKMGIPTIFVRLSGCNLNCDFCDSKYHKNGQQKSIDEIVDAIKKYNCRDITITGGEPTLQEGEVSKLIKKLEGYIFNIESNGVLLTKLNYDNIIISPKKQKFNIKNLYTYSHDLKYKNKTWFKFVYENKNNKWWEDVINKAKIDKNRVYIMPEGATREEQIKKMPEVIEYCLKTGFKFSGRLHILAYNTKRGV